MSKRDTRTSSSYKVDIDKTLSKGLLENRFLNKNGSLNLPRKNKIFPTEAFYRDIFTTLVDLKWRYVFIIYAAAYFSSWVLFSLIWYGIAMLNGDILNKHNESWVPCVYKVNSFTSAFTFSVECQNTIGFGYHYVTSQCPQAIILMCIQTIFGCMLLVLMTGFVFTKVKSPHRRSPSLKFSEHAAISKRNGIDYLMVRIANIRKTPLISPTVKAYFVAHETTQEGEDLLFHHTALDITFGNNCNTFHLIKPAILAHKIDENSPIYKIWDSYLWKVPFEIIFIIEGSLQSTDQLIQVRQSYTASDIRLHHRFCPIIDSGDAAIDYRILDSMEYIEPVQPIPDKPMQLVHDEPMQPIPDYPMQPIPDEPMQPIPDYPMQPMVRNYTV